MPAFGVVAVKLDIVFGVVYKNEERESKTKVNRTEPKRYQARPVTVASDPSVPIVALSIVLINLTRSPAVIRQRAMYVEEERVS